MANLWSAPDRNWQKPKICSQNIKKEKEKRTTISIFVYRLSNLIIKVVLMRHYNQEMDCPRCESTKWIIILSLKRSAHQKKKKILLHRVHKPPKGRKATYFYLTKILCEFWRWIHVLLQIQVEVLKNQIQTFLTVNHVL